MPSPDLDAHLAVHTEGLARGPEVRRALARLLEQHPGLSRQIEDNPAMRSLLLGVLAASRSLTRLLDQHPASLAVLRHPHEPVPAPDPAVAEPADLVTWKQFELLRIAALDVGGLADFEQVGAALTDLAAGVFSLACAMARHRSSGPDVALAVIGMGKTGGRELNYASDVDVLFVGDGPRDELVREAQTVLETAARCFRVDTNLRPEGRDGPLVRSLESYEAYWDRWAEPWEFQALLKARPIAGDPALGQRFLDTAQRWLWSHPFDADALRSIRRLKARSEVDANAEARRHPGEELKRSRGGIRDIEFTAQLLQLVHGHLDPDLRDPNTLATLAELGQAGYIDPADATTLTNAYRFLRTVEHRLQLVDEQQTHTVPDDPLEREHLARVLGYRDAADASATEQFDTDVRRVRNQVRSVHERVYFRPLLEAFSGPAGRPAAEPQLGSEAASARLNAFGFTDTTRTAVAVRELTRGLTRTSRMMQQLLPLLLDWLADAPDPDLGLLMLRNLLTGPERMGTVLTAFRDSPDAARRTCTLLGTSRLLGDVLLHNPDVVPRLPREDQLLLRGGDELTASARAVMGWRTDLVDRRDALRRWKDRQLLGVAARDLFGFADVGQVGRDLAALADASLEATLAVLDGGTAPSVRFAVLGVGRYGAAELSYASDLDLLFVYDGDGPGATEEAARLATTVLRFLGGDTPAQRVWQPDLGLRPEGRQGPLARRIDAYEQYWRTWAEPWERLAMTRARVVAGDRELGEALLRTLEPHVWDAPLTDDDRREIRRVKARMETERIPAGEDARFHLKLGRGSLSDIEFTVQLLQLATGTRGTGTLRALADLVDDGAIAREDADLLETSYRFCERTRNRWYLVNSGPGDSLPTQPEPLRWLARSLGTTSTELREQYRRVTRRSRRVVERLFYGNDAITG